MVVTSPSAMKGSDLSTYGSQIFRQQECIQKAKRAFCQFATFQGSLSPVSTTSVVECCMLWCWKLDYVHKLSADINQPSRLWTTELRRSNWSSEKWSKSNIRSLSAKEGLTVPSSLQDCRQSHVKLDATIPWINGGSCITSIRNLVKIMTYPNHAVNKCSLCKTTELNDLLPEHLLKALPLSACFSRV